MWYEYIKQFTAIKVHYTHLFLYRAAVLRSSGAASWRPPSHPLLHITPQSSAKCLPIFCWVALTSSLYIRRCLRGQEADSEADDRAGRLPRRVWCFRTGPTPCHPRVPCHSAGGACCFIQRAPVTRKFRRHISSDCGFLETDCLSTSTWQFRTGSHNRWQVVTQGGQAWQLKAGSIAMGKRSYSSQVTDVEATESWNDKNTHVRVTQPEGFMCQVRVC